MKYKVYSPSTPDELPLERENRALARQVAAEGIVLLTNDGTLPLRTKTVALFGAGARHTIRGGSGSGDMRERYSVSIEQGLKKAGVTLASTEWLDAYDAYYDRLRTDWTARMEQNIRKRGLLNVMAIFDELAKEPFRFPVGEKIRSEQMGDAADTALYVIARQAGEGTDRKLEKGDFYLDDVEQENLQILTEHYPHVVVPINCGGMIDCSFMDKLPGIGALVYIGQPGTEGGNAVADVLTGKCTPSGKLTDTWACSYKDYPGAMEYSYLNGDTEQENYKEGIFVGYRWFDAQNLSIRYPFGYGLSYTSFTWKAENVRFEKNSILLNVCVENTGNCKGREVVQLYMSKPQTARQNPVRELAAFAKTKELAPGEKQTLVLEFPAEWLAAYDAQQHCWTVDAGEYGVWVGNSSRNLRCVACLTVTEQQHGTACNRLSEQYPAWQDVALDLESMAIPDDVPHLTMSPIVWPEQAGTEPAIDPAVEQKLQGLTVKELVSLVVGGSLVGNCYNNTPGAVGRTTSSLVKKDIPNINLCDGPAGLNVFPESVITKSGGQKYLGSVPDSYNWGLLKKLTPFLLGKPTDGRPCYQYMTAWPCETVQAQTWNVELLTKIGAAVGQEMQQIGATLWLAPGMNIHRNPLCGRNFEYYSEDPLLTGMMAAAITKGVQSIHGVGVTIKHFCCNNQEDNRTHVSANASERALREIYLRGFEYCIRQAQPWAVMSSYNRVNGEYVNNNARLCRDVLRREWGFAGLVMTDWSATGNQNGVSARCPAAGNDLIMPGSGKDRKQLMRGLKDGTVRMENVRRSAARVLTAIQSSNVTEV